MLHPKFRRIISILLINLWIVLFTPNSSVLAATMSYATGGPSTSLPNTSAYHEIKFITSSGVNAPGQTIIINFGLYTGYVFNSSTYNNYRMMVGSSNNCSATTGWTQKSLAGSASSGTWGVVADVVNFYITFTAPTDATTGEIPTNRCVWISVGGPNTTSGTSFITNPSLEITNMLSIEGTFGDTGDFSELMVSATPDFSVSNVQLIVNADHTLKIDDAAITYSLPPTAGELQFYFIPDTSCASGSIASIKSALATYPYCVDPIGFAVLRPNDYYWYNDSAGWLVIGACHDASVDCGNNPTQFDVGFISSVQFKSGIGDGTVTLQNAI